MIPAAANALWGDVAWARERLQPFAGRTVHVTVWPIPGFGLRVAPDGTWEPASPLSGEQADVRLRFTPALVPRLAGAPDKPGSALDGDGDPEFLQALRDLGDVLPLAFEERLSSIVGPLAAHGISSTMRALAAWPAIAVDRINAGVGAYFTEESQTLLKKSSLAAFAEELATLAERVNRAERSAPAAREPATPGD
jgi:ubiquinone biosynthesis protein UbiJ